RDCSGPWGLPVRQPCDTTEELGRSLVLRLGPFRSRHQCGSALTPRPVQPPCDTISAPRRNLWELRRLYSIEIRGRFVRRSLLARRSAGVGQERQMAARYPFLKISLPNFLC